MHILVLYLLYIPYLLYICRKGSSPAVCLQYCQPPLHCNQALNTTESYPQPASAACDSGCLLLAHWWHARVGTTCPSTLPHAVRCEACAVWWSGVGRDSTDSLPLLYSRKSCNG